MQFTYQLTPEDFYQGMLAWRSRRRWQQWLLRVAYVIVAMVFLSCLITLVLGWGGATTSTALGGIVFCTVWGTAIWAGPRFSSRRQFKNNPTAQSPITMDASEAGLEIQTGHMNSKVAWSAYMAWGESKSVFVIMPQPRIYVPIPKRAFSEEQVGEFREILRRNIKTS
jgi:hypothetical protein